MDGFTPSDGVIVIAATNRPMSWTPRSSARAASTARSTVPLPDVKGRLEILKVHAKKVKLGPDVDLEKVARGTPMFSGADLAAIINEAAIGATMHNKDFIEHEDLEEARDKVKFGRAKRAASARRTRTSSSPTTRPGTRCCRRCSRMRTRCTRSRSSRAALLRRRDLQPAREGPHGLQPQVAEGDHAVLCGGRIAEKGDGRCVQRRVQDISQSPTSPAR
jgi:hypothetical protein